MPIPPNPNFQAPDLDDEAREEIHDLALRLCAAGGNKVEANDSVLFVAVAFRTGTLTACGFKAEPTGIERPIIAPSRALLYAALEVIRNVSEEHAARLGIPPQAIFQKIMEGELPHGS